MILDQAYGPSHPFWLGDDTLPPTPAAEALMAAAADIEQMHVEGHTVGAVTTEGRLIVRLTEHGGRQQDLAVLLDAGLFVSPGTAWMQWEHRPHDAAADEESEDVA